MAARRPIGGPIGPGIVGFILGILVMYIYNHYIAVNVAPTEPTTEIRVDTNTMNKDMPRLPANN